MSGALNGAERFDRAYAADPDPWRVDSSAYERHKREATLAMLGGRRFGSALEVGCGTGALSERLAAFCESVLASDFSAVAVALAERRLARIANVTVARLRFPEQIRPQGFELVVCSEILYYLDPQTFEQRALAWFAEAVACGASVLVVDWRGGGETEPLRGDDVHAQLRAALSANHRDGAVHPRYRLDLFEPGCGLRPPRGGSQACGPRRTERRR